MHIRIELPMNYQFINVLEIGWYD